MTGDGSGSSTPSTIARRRPSSIHSRDHRLVAETVLAGDLLRELQQVLVHAKRDELPTTTGACLSIRPERIVGRLNGRPAAVWNHCWSARKYALLSRAKGEANRGNLAIGLHRAETE